MQTPRINKIFTPMGMAMGDHAHGAISAMSVAMSWPQDSLLPERRKINNSELRELL